MEVKLGQGQIDRAADSLKKCVESNDTSTVGDPAAIMVITVGDIAYRRSDGVLVVPLSALGA